MFFSTKPNDFVLQTQIAEALLTQKLATMATTGDVRIAADPNPQDQELGVIHFNGQVYEYQTDAQGNLKAGSLARTGRYTYTPGQCVEYATEQRIDSVWTLVFERLGQGLVRILGYDRENAYGYQHKKELPLLKLIETPGRIVRTVLLAPYDPFAGWATERTATETLTVDNPQEIFSYTR